MISERSVVRRFARDTLTFLTVSLVFSATVPPRTRTLSTARRHDSRHDRRCTDRGCRGRHRHSERRLYIATANQCRSSGGA